jgi:hypothetical protein
MSEFVVASDVPMRRGSNDKYPFGSMSVGDSFFVPGVTTKTSPGANRFTGQNGRVRFPDRGFTVRSTTEDGIAGVRCWRTK